MIRIMKMGEVAPAEIFARAVPETDVSATVRDIIADVRQNGDAALLRYTERFDGAKLDSLLVSQEETREALDGADPEFLRVLSRAAENIRLFHQAQRASS